MRIGVFHDDCGDPGGANSYRIRLCSLLKEMGHDIHLFTYRGDSDCESDDNATVFVPSGPRVTGGRLPQHRLPDISVYKAFRKWMDQTAPDILHIHTNHSFASSILMGCMGRVPVVQTVHDFRIVCPIGRAVTPGGRLCGGGVGWQCAADRCLSRKRFALEVPVRRLEYYLMRKALYRLIAPSAALHEALKRDNLPSVHIPHFSDIEAFEPGSSHQDARTILFVGFLHFSKGVWMLLNAFKRVVEEIPSARLLIAGDGPVMEELRERHGELKLGDAVTFLGAVPENEVAKWFERSLFSVLPSIVFENSPLTIYEAMACGRAVVGARIGGIPELIEDGRTGLLFEPDDEIDLARKMTRLLREPDLAKRMGRVGRQRAEGVFTIDKHLDAILGLYRSAMDSA